MRKLLLFCNNDSYNISNGETIVETKLDGGLSRRRRDILGAAKECKVSFILDRQEYLYLRCFYDTECCQGALPFLIDLVLDTPLLVERQAWFITPGPELTEQKGLMYMVKAELEVLPLAIDATANTAYLDAYEADPDAAWAAYLATLP